MKSKTIKKVIQAKLEDWIKSINDNRVAALVRQNTIVTGGCIASMLLKEPVKDFDIYFKDKETTKAVAEYYVKLFNEKNSAGAEVLDGDDPNRTKGKSVMLENVGPGRVKIYIRSRGVAAEERQADVLSEPFEDVFDVLDQADTIPENNLEQAEPGEEKYRPIFLSANAITLSDKLQIVVRFYGEPDQIHENYDFVHCTNYYDHGKNELTLKPDALECLLARELKYQGSKYPLCSIIRTRKFIKRGYTINAGQYLKMCFQLSKLNLEDINVLEDQLVGVDSAYFTMLIDGLRSKMANDPNFKIEENYLTSIVDRMF